MACTTRIRSLRPLAAVAVGGLSLGLGSFCVLAPRARSRALGGVIRLQSCDAREDGGFLHLEGGSYGTLSETVGGALRGAKARVIVTASRDDVFEDISQADSRNSNPERDSFRTTQVVARLTLAPTARLTLESSALLRIICVRL